MAKFATGDTPSTQQWNEIAENSLGTNTVASSNNINIGDDEYFITVTGTTDIDTITTAREGRKFALYLDSAASDSLRLTSGGNLVLPDAAGGTGGDYYLIPGTMVQMIQDTNSEFHIVGSSVLSNSPNLLAYQAAANSGLSGVQTIEFDTITIDNYDGFDPTTNYDYTIPYTGRYDINVNARYSSTGSAERLTTTIDVNGSTICRQQVSTATFTGGTSDPARVSVLLSQGDTVTATSTDNGGTYTINGGSANTNISIRWAI